MGDNEFRSLRRPAVDSSADRDNEISDPLAELAKLIGQGDPRGAFGREDDAADTYGEAPSARAIDWAGEDHAGPGHEPAPDRRYDHAPAAPRQFSPPLSGDAHDDAHDESYRDGAEEDAPYDEEPPHAGDDDAGDYSYAEAYTEPYAESDAAESDAEYDEGYDDPYEDKRSGIGRRSRTSSVVLGIVGLIVLGSAGAFGYRAMFGGSVFPALPPIIKPSGAPVKIVPNHDSQAAAPNQTAVANASDGDHLVSHEEQPVEVQAATPAPHAVTTIPVISNTPADGVLPATQPPATSAPAAGPETASAAPAETAPTEAAPPPKPVHTVTIHTNRSTGANPTAAGERPARAVREADSGGPLSIISGGETEVPSGSRPREADARSEQSPPSASPPAEAGSKTGGYAVQVSSQRSEAEAEATFHSLQTKYPQQLGNQHGMVRRADLGPKGIYYRALVGPFASAQDASRLCSSLKAAGGSCIVQRN